MKIAEQLHCFQPREKLLREDACRLSDAELLAILLRTGTTGMSALQLAQSLLMRFGNLHNILNASQHALCQTKGIGLVSYTLLQASVELVQRYHYEDAIRQAEFSCVDDARYFFNSQLRHEQREVFGVAFLDNQHRLLSFRKLFFGSINCASVYPRVVLQKVLEVNAAAVMLAHNHPSGVTEPSEADIRITKRISEALALIDVRLLDHFVVGIGRTVSMAHRGLI